MLDWEFQTSQASQAWSDLLRDMIPCALILWTSLPGFENRWSVSRLSPPSGKKGPYRVTLLLWPQPSTDVAW